LLRRPLIAKDDRNLGDAQVAGGLQPQVPIHDLAVAASEDRDLEPELADGSDHPIDCSIVLPWVPGVEDQLVDGPELDLKRGGRGHYAP
jgi:hypothetical protein